MPSVEAEEALSSFSELVDEKVGIIRAVELVRLSEVDPQVHLAYATPCDTVPLAGIAAANKGAACATTSEDAVIRACGECIERYCSAFWDPSALVAASESSLRASGARALNAGHFYPYAENQYAAPEFPFDRPDADRTVNWVATTSLAVPETVYVPAGCVYVPYRFEAGQDPFTHIPISTGLAAGRDLRTCVDKGLCEIIERDALMIVWNARIAAPRIDLASCLGASDTVDRLLGCVTGPRTTWYLNLLSLDIDVPVISAALIDEGSPPLTSFGIAAHVDPVRALASALEEALLTRLLVNRSSDVHARESPPAAAVRTLRDHLVAHASSVALRDRMRFLTDDGPRVALAEIRGRYDMREPVADCLARADLEACWVDLSTPDVADFGFVVTRALVAGMQPLDNDHKHRYQGGNRLWTVPRDLGHVVTSLNPDPHPFP